MKRSPMVIVLGCIVCLLIALLAGAQASPQTSTQKWQQKPHWTTLTPRGIKVLRGFKKTSCPAKEERKREVVILELNENRYQEFKQDPKKFVNDYHVFSCPVTDMKRLKRPEEIEKASPGGDPIIMVAHEPNCVAYYYD